VHHVFIHCIAPSLFTSAERKSFNENFVVDTIIIIIIIIVIIIIVILLDVLPHTNMCGLLKLEMYSLSETLGLWIADPLEVWMSVCVYSVLLLLCVYVAPWDRLIPRQRSPTDSV
jgi:hypothetical protein